MNEFSSNHLYSMLEEHQSKLTSMFNLSTVFTNKPPSPPIPNIITNQSIPIESNSDLSCLPTGSAPLIPLSTTNKAEDNSNSAYVVSSYSNDLINSPMSPSVTSHNIEQLLQENAQLRRDRADLQRILAHCVSRKSRHSSQRPENVDKQKGSETPTKIHTIEATAALSPGRFDTTESSHTDLDGRAMSDEKRKVSSKEVFLVLRGEIKRSKEAAADLDTRLKSALLKLQESRVESLQVLPLRLRLREMEQSYKQSLETLTDKFNAKEEECIQLINVNKQLTTSEVQLKQALVEEKTHLSNALNKVEFLQFHVEVLSDKLAFTEQELTTYRHENVDLVNKLRLKVEALSVCSLEKGHLERRTSSLSKEVVRMQELCTELKVSEPEEVVKYVRFLQAKSGCSVGGTDVTSGSETMSTVDDVLGSVNIVTHSYPSSPSHTYAHRRSSDRADRSRSLTGRSDDKHTSDSDFSDGGCFPPILFCGWNSQGGGTSKANKQKSAKRSTFSKLK